MEAGCGKLSFSYPCGGSFEFSLNAILSTIGHHSVHRCDDSRTSPEA
jgi:hypothetical protein